MLTLLPLVANVPATCCKAEGPRIADALLAPLDDLDADLGPRCGIGEGV